MRCPPALSKRCKTKRVTTKPGWFVLVTLGIVKAVGLNPVFYFIMSPWVVVIKSVTFSVYGFVMVALMMFPVFGLAGEVCYKRFRIITFGIALMTVGAILFTVLYGISQEPKNAVYLFNFILLGIFLIIAPSVGIINSSQCFAIWH